MFRTSSKEDFYKSGKVTIDADGIPVDLGYRGTGSPEGKVAAPVGSVYTDTAATNGSIRWIKASGTGSTGWRDDYGDTTAALETKADQSVITDATFKVGRGDTEHANRLVKLNSSGKLYISRHSIVNPSDPVNKLYADMLVYKGVVDDGTDFDTIREPGIYSVATVASARTMINYPTACAGIVMVWTNAGASVTTQEVTAYVSTTSPVEKYSRATLSSVNTAWAQWVTSEWTKELINGTADARTNVDTFRTPGAWGVSSRTYVDGLPGTGTGVLEVFAWAGTGVSAQRYSERVTGGDVIWHRSSASTAGFAGIEWQQITGNQGGDSGNVPEVTSHQSPEATHAARVEYARSRRGGGIGTGGKPVIMLRFDHWLVAFRDKVLPILRKHQLPATLNMNFDNINIEANGGGSISWEDVQDWNQRYGIEIANHGSTHRNPADAAGIYHEIVNGRRNLEAAMPRVAVETWQEHGSAYLIASDIDGDIGLDIGREPKNFFESYAGQLVLAEHAIIEGKSGGFFHPINGSPQIGQSHYSADRSTAAQAIAQVDNVQALGRGLTLYTHPGSMNNAVVGGKYWPYEEQEDGSFIVTNPADSTTQTFADWDAMNTWAVNDGNWLNMSFAHFDELCAHLAAERDADRLMVMTAAGGAFADKSHDRRENLLVKADFTDGYSTWWSGTTGWTVTNPGAEVELTSTSSAGQLNQGMLLYSRFGWAMGAAHELVVSVSANTETTLTLRGEQMGNAENWNVEETFDVPGDGVARDYRINITLPRDRSITQLRWYIGGPSMTIHGTPILAAI